MEGGCDVGPGARGMRVSAAYLGGGAMPSSARQAALMPAGIPGPQRPVAGRSTCEPLHREKRQLDRTPYVSVHAACPECIRPTCAVPCSRVSAGLPGPLPTRPQLCARTGLHSLHRRRGPGGPSSSALSSGAPALSFAGLPCVSPGWGLPGPCRRVVPLPPACTLLGIALSTYTD